MKKSMTFLLSLGVVAYSSGAFVYGQGKAVGRTSLPTVSQTHGQSGTRPVKTTSGPSAETKGQPTKTTWETKLSQRFESDTAFRTRMENLLPEGMSLETAQSGFKNRGQFIAALHVSQNLGIAFDQLKEKMTGIPATPDTTTTTSTTSTTTTTTTETNSEPMSLGKAIQELKPTLTSTEVTVEVKKAEKQAGTTEKTAPTS
jgi:hypothetical protein